MRKELAQCAREMLSERSDADLNALLDRCHSAVIEAVRMVGTPRMKWHHKAKGWPLMSLPEIVLFEVRHNRAKMYELPSPRGGRVADHLPPGYVRFRGEPGVMEGYREELGWNDLGFDVPIGTKEYLAACKLVKALKMYEAPAGNTRINLVRLLVAEAQYALLYKWEERLNRPRRLMAREETIDTIVDCLCFITPALLRREAVQK